MGNNFYGPYHWEFTPIDDRVNLLDALKVFCSKNSNLFIESLSPSLIRRFQFWQMKARYQTALIPDTLCPQPAIFHISLNEGNLESLKTIVNRRGLNEKDIAHIKGYSGKLGLFWFHGFCDEAEDTLFCSCHIDGSIIEKLEVILRVKGEKKFGELKSDRERDDDLNRIFDAMERAEQ